MDSPANLRAVLKILPATCYENPTWKGVLWAARDFAVYAGIVVLLTQVDSLWLIPLWILAGMSISALFILGHDAAHRALFKSNRTNHFMAQLLMLPSLHIHEGWIFGHNRLHHGHTTRQQLDFVWHPLTPSEYDALSVFHKLVHRVFWSPFGAGLYYGVDVWWKKMISFKPPKRRAEYRAEKSCVFLYALLFSGALLYGGYASAGTAGGALWMWFKVFAVPFVVWNYSIGLTVYLNHIDVDIPWHRRKEWERFSGQVESTTVITLPWWLNFFYHNIFLHVAHHVDTRIPFYGLPAATQALREHYGDVLIERKLSLRSYLRTTRRCKLFDFETRTWHGYGEPRPAPTPDAWPPSESGRRAESRETVSAS